MVSIMPFFSRIFFCATAILLSTATAYIVTYAASFPSGTGNNASTYGNPASSTNKQKNILNNQGSKAPAADNAEQKEPNPILYENYQQCYASLISDYVGRSNEEIDARKVTIKKYCRAITNVKYQKRFSDCFNGNIGSGNRPDDIINECISSNDKTLK